MITIRSWTSLALAAALFSSGALASSARAQAEQGREDGARSATPEVQVGAESPRGAEEPLAEGRLAEERTANEAEPRGVRLRAGITGGFALGGAEAQREGGFMLFGTVHARLGLQLGDVVALYYEAGGYFGGWPRRCEETGRNCSEHGAALHTSSGMLELTFDWFQIAGGGGVIAGVVAGHETWGLEVRGRLAYVDGWQRPDRAGFTVGADIMTAALFDGCWAHTTQFSVGYEWF